MLLVPNHPKEEVKHTDCVPCRRHAAESYEDLPVTPEPFIEGMLEAEHHDTFQVPNIVHYIWYQEEVVELRFDKVLCILSAIKNIKPDAVYFHTNKEPSGKYYEMLKQYPIFKVLR